jgi:hypothetical protein
MPSIHDLLLVWVSRIWVYQFCLVWFAGKCRFRCHDDPFERSLAETQKWDETASHLACHSHNIAIHNIFVCHSLQHQQPMRVSFTRLLKHTILEITKLPRTVSRFTYQLVIMSTANMTQEPPSKKLRMGQVEEPSDTMHPRDDVELNIEMKTSSVTSDVGLDCDVLIVGAGPAGLMLAYVHSFFNHQRLSFSPFFVSFCLSHPSMTSSLLYVRCSCPQRKRKAILTLQGAIWHDMALI